MDFTSTPLATLYGYAVGKYDLVFVGKEGDIKLTMRKHRSSLVSILALCNGHRTLLQIREKVLTIKIEDFDSLIGLAEEFKLISDSRELYLDFHEASSNPLKFNQLMSPAAIPPSIKKSLKSIKINKSTKNCEFCRHVKSRTKKEQKIIDNSF